MARIARIVLPGLPHLITQRGYEDRQTFFCADDFRAYLRYVALSCAEWEVRVWAYCLMPNGVHLLVVPKSERALARSLGEAHRRYAREVNTRRKKPGQLWHARFTSCSLEGNLLAEAVRAVERCPVEAGMAENPWEYPWSSAAARVVGRPDPLNIGETPPSVADWPAFLSTPSDPALLAAFAAHQRTGRPYGSPAFILGLEEKLNRRLRPRKRGRKPKVRPPGDDA